MKDHLHKESFARKLPRICRKGKTLLSGWNYWKKQRRLEEYLTQHDQESRTVSLLIYDPDLLRSMTGPTSRIKVLLLRVQESVAATLVLPCNTREDSSILGNVLVCQHARRDPDELHSWFKNFGDIIALLRTERIEKSESERPLQLTPLSCSQVGARQQVQTVESVLSMTNHALGFGTCTQGTTILRYLSSEMHQQKLPDQTKFQSWIVNFRAEVYAKARNKRKGANFLHWKKDWLIQMETSAIFYTRDAVRPFGEKWETQTNLA